MNKAMRGSSIFFAALCAFIVIVAVNSALPKPVEAQKEAAIDDTFPVVIATADLWNGRTLVRVWDEETHKLCYGLRGLSNSLDCLPKDFARVREGVLPMSFQAASTKDGREILRVYDEETYVTCYVLIGYMIGDLGCVTKEKEHATPSSSYLPIISGGNDERDDH